MQIRTKLFLAAGVAAGFALSGCGAAGTSDGSSAANTVSGVASAAVPLASVSLRDSASPSQSRATAPAGDGAYSIDVAGLTAPFLLKAEDATGATRLYAIAKGPGRTDVNELSNAACKAAGGGDGEDDEWEDDHEPGHASVDLEKVIRTLRTVLAPLFDLYHVTPFGEHEDDDAEEGALRALLHDVSFTVQDGSLAVTNRLTGGVIYSAPLKDLTSGTFHPENLPPGPGGGPGATCSSFTYSAWSPAVCDATGLQTRTVVSASPAGCTGGSPVLSQACTPPATTCTSFTYSAWSPAVCDATGLQTRTVVSASPAGCTGGSPVLSQACTPPATTCTSFTYSAWSPAVCDATGVQTRTVVSASPAGCTGGSPVLSQTCTPPLDGAALYQQSCSRCHGALASSNLKGRNISVASIKAAGMSQGLTDAQLQAIVTAVGP